MSVTVEIYDSNFKHYGDIKISEIKGYNGVLIYYDLFNLNPGKHGFHLHEKSDSKYNCDNMGSHYNPLNQLHGGLDSSERHLGDLGNIYVNDDGVAQGTLFAPLVSLSGLYSIIGKSIMIHENEDDLGIYKYTSPDSSKTGNSGKRIACGNIL
jgi:superoxide dismutase, Cu-Zn family